MIFATWSSKLGPWYIKVPKDSFWGDQKPEHGDEVMIILKDGRFEKNYLYMMAGEDETAWYFPEDEDPFGSLGLDDADDWTRDYYEQQF